MTVRYISLSICTYNSAPRCCLQRQGMFRVSHRNSNIQQELFGSLNEINPECECNFAYSNMKRAQGADSSNRSVCTAINHNVEIVTLGGNNLCISTNRRSYSYIQYTVRARGSVSHIKHG